MPIKYGMSLVSVKNQLTHFTRRQEKKGTKASKDKIVVASIQKAMSTSCSTFRTDRGKEREREDGEKGGAEQGRLRSVNKWVCINEVQEVTTVGAQSLHSYTSLKYQGK